MLIPLNDHLLVRRVDRPDQTEGGVYLPETAHTREADEGIVLDSSNHDSVIVGKRIVFRAYGGCEVEVDGEKLLLLPHKNVFGVYQEN